MEHAVTRHDILLGDRNTCVHPHHIVKDTPLSTDQ